MDDYFDRVEAQLAELTRRGAHRTRRRELPQWPWPGLAGAVPVLASVLIVAAVVGLLLSLHPASRHRAPSSGPRPAAHPGLVVPSTYGAACSPDDYGPGPLQCTSSRRVPAALHRPLRLAMLRPGQRCPTTAGATVNNSYFGGVALGPGPVRVLLADAGELRHGIVDIGPSGTRGWGAIQTLWFSARAYQGPFVIRGERLDRPGTIAVGDAGIPHPDQPLLVAPGPTQNTYAETGRNAAGIRTVPSAIWVRAPGCYGLQVDGLTFTETIVLRAVPFRARGAG